MLMLVAILAIASQIVTALPGVPLVPREIAYANTSVDLDISVTGPSSIDPTKLYQYASYTLTVHNPSTIDVRNVEVELDGFMNGMTFIRKFGNFETDRECDKESFAIVCDDFEIKAGKTKILTIVLGGHASTPGCGRSITHTAKLLNSSPSDTQSGNNQESITTTIQCKKPQLVIRPSHVWDINDGEEIEWFVLIDNNGESITQNTTLEVDLPEGYTFLSGKSSPICDKESGSDTIECTPFTVHPGFRKLIRIGMRAPDPIDCDLDLDAFRFYAFSDASKKKFSGIGNGNQQCHFLSNVPPGHPFHGVEARTEGPKSVRPGETVSFTVTLFNNSKTPITKSLLSNSFRDWFPAEFIEKNSSKDCATTYSGSHGDIVYCGNTDDFIHTKYDVGQKRTFKVTWKLPDDLQCHETIRNLVNFAIWSADPPFDGNLASDEEGIYVDCPLPEPPETDVSIKKTGATTVPLGETIDYTLTVKNSGPDTAENVEVTDTIPSGLTFLSSSGPSHCERQGAEVVCDPISLEDDEEEEYILTFQVPTQVHACKSSFTNTARIDSSTADTNMKNNMSTSKLTEIICGEITVTKTAKKSTVEHGDTVAFDIRVTSKKDQGAKGVFVTDNAPAGFEVHDDTKNDTRCSTTRTRITCGPLNIDGKGKLDFTFMFTVLPNAPCGPITNEVTATAANVHGTEKDSDSVNVRCSPPELTIKKDVDKTTMKPGDSLTYTIEVENIGGAAEKYVEVLDTIPTNTGLRYTGFRASDNASNCTKRPTFIECVKENLDPKSSITFTLLFASDSTLACEDIIENTAKVEGVDAGRKDSKVVKTTVEACPKDPKLTATKKTPTKKLLPGDPIIYTIRVDNIGEDTAENVFIEDAIPEGLEFERVVSSDDRDKCTFDRNTVICGPYTIEKNRHEEVELEFTFNP